MDRVRDTDSVRRRRRMGRPMREKTPDSGRLLQDDEYQEIEVDNVSLVSSTRSAHESKILRRRDKNFRNIAARSHSQPRQAERLSSPEAQELIRTAKRSLSSPRHKEDAVSESDMSTDPYYSRNRTAVEEGSSRLEQNLRRFEEERKRFEAEKRQFERERLEHKIRNKQLYDSDERRRFLQTYHHVKPKEVEERRKLVHSLRLQRNEVPHVLRRPDRYSSTCAESSTQLSSSETEDSNGANYFAKNLSPQRKNVIHVVIPVRGPPPPPPRRSVSRNNSLSPLRPERRSKTPEGRAEIIRRLNVETNNDEVEAGQDQVDNKENKEVCRKPKYAETQLRRRKKSIEEKPCIETTENLPSADTKSDVVDSTNESKNALKKPLTFFESLKLAFKKSSGKTLATSTTPDSAQKSVKQNCIKLIYDGICSEWRCLKADYPNEMLEIKAMRNKCISHTIFLILFCGFGGLMFRYTEGSAENVYKCEVRKVKRDFIENLWSVSHNMREDDWKLLARQKLRKFEEELQELNQLGMRYYYPGQRSWNFVNSILYCWTVITTIGRALSLVLLQSSTFYILQN